jgi:hypothetical protein
VLSMICDEAIGSFLCEKCYERKLIALLATETGRLGSLAKISLFLASHIFQQPYLGNAAQILLKMLFFLVDILYLVFQFCKRWLILRGHLTLLYIC